MEALLVEVALHLVPRHQTAQHADAAHNVSSSRRIEVDCAAIGRVQARVVGERFFLLRGKRAGFGGLVGEVRVEQVRGEGHGVEVQTWGTA